MTQRVVLSTRHISVLTWLQRHHPDLVAGAEYLPNVRSFQLDPDTTLIGSWPTHLLTRSGQYLTIEFEQRPSTSELTPEQMDQLGAHLVRYTLLDDNQLSALVQAAMKQAAKDSTPDECLAFGLDIVDALRRMK